MKTFSSILPGVVLAAVYCVTGLSVHAQTTAPTQVTPTSPAPAKGIGPAPANTPQHTILSTALSPETRQTLQQAMNSVPAPAAK